MIHTLMTVSMCSEARPRPCDVVLADESGWLSSSKQLPTRLRLFSGTANPTLAAEVAHYLGMDLGKINIKSFADGEIFVQARDFESRGSLSSDSRS